MISLEKYYLCLDIELDETLKTLCYRNERNLDINNIEDQIFIFEQEVTEWLFRPIWKLLEEDNNDLKNGYKYKPFRNSIYVLFGLFAFIEKMELYRKGKESAPTSQTLKEGINRIFGLKNDKLKPLLDATRHKLSHEATIGDDTLLNLQASKAIDIDKGKIIINPNLMFVEIGTDYTEYLKNLRDFSNRRYDVLRKDFKKKFTKVYEKEIDILK